MQVYNEKTRDSETGQKVRRTVISINQPTKSFLEYKYVCMYLKI